MEDLRIHEPYEVPGVQLWRIGTPGPSNTGGHVDFVVPLIDPRVRTSISVVMRNDDGTATANAAVGDNLAWICSRVKDPQSGQSYPVTNIVGTGSNSGNMGALFIDNIGGGALPTSNSLQGWSIETNSIAAEVFGALRLGGAAWAGTGRAAWFNLLVKYQLAEPMCLAEWIALQGRMNPRLITEPGFTSSV